MCDMIDWDFLNTNMTILQEEESSAYVIIASYVCACAKGTMKKTVRKTILYPAKSNAALNFEE